LNELHNDNNIKSINFSNQHFESVMTGKDSEIIPRLLTNYHCQRPIADLTYGKGRFWNPDLQPDHAFDIAAGDNHDGSDSLFQGSTATTRADFKDLSDHLANESVATVIWDPPHLYRPSNENKTSVYGIYNIEAFNINKEMGIAVKEISRILRPGGIVIAKLSNEISRDQWHVDKFRHESREVGLVPFDEVVKLRSGVSIRNTAQKQWRARRRHCYFVICKKPEAKVKRVRGKKVTGSLTLEDLFR